MEWLGGAVEWIEEWRVGAVVQAKLPRVFPIEGVQRQVKACALRPEPRFVSVEGRKFELQPHMCPVKVRPCSQSRHKPSYGGGQGWTTSYGLYGHGLYIVMVQGAEARTLPRLFCALLC